MIGPPFRIGDVVECIGVRWKERGSDQVHAGPAYTNRMPVALVRSVLHPATGEPTYALGFKRWPGQLYLAENFTAVVPKPDPVDDAANANWLFLLLAQCRKFEGRK